MVQYSSTYARVNAYEPIRPSPFIHYPYVVVTNIVVHLLIVSQRSTLRGFFLPTFSLPVPDHIGARCPRPCRPSRSVFCDSSSQVNPTQTQRGRKPNPEQVFPPSPDQGQRKCNCSATASSESHSTPSVCGAEHWYYSHLCTPTTRPHYPAPFPTPPAFLSCTLLQYYKPQSTYTTGLDST